MKAHKPRRKNLRLHANIGFVMVLPLGYYITFWLYFGIIVLWKQIIQIKNKDLIDPLIQALLNQRSQVDDFLDLHQIVDLQEIKILLEEEEVEKEDLFVIKKDGRREKFDRHKLLSGLEKSCELIRQYVGGMLWR